jgi:hypothetical protein
LKYLTANHLAGNLTIVIQSSSTARCARVFVGAILNKAFGMAVENLIERIREGVCGYRSARQGCLCAA